MAHRYVHGYTARESQRLNEQSRILEEILHRDVFFAPGSMVLEAGCGIGAQSEILQRKMPAVEYNAVDISLESLIQASQRRLPDYSLEQADVYHLPFRDDSFDHVFVCFLLEHLYDPLKALTELRRVLKPRGTITAIEGDHGSCFWHPETEASLRVWNALITVQAGLGHDSNIGRRLYPLIMDAGFSDAFTTPCWLYADAASPRLLNGMVNQIIVPMVKTAREAALVQGLADPEIWDRGIRELEASGNPPAGTFFYTWFKTTAVK
jgi:SAM-dependent methyltransferase